MYNYPFKDVKQCVYSFSCKLIGKFRLKISHSMCKLNGKLVFKCLFSLFKNHKVRIKFIKCFQRTRDAAMVVLSVPPHQALHRRSQLLLLMLSRFDRKLIKFFSCFWLEIKIVNFWKALVDYSFCIHKTRTL